MGEKLWVIKDSNGNYVYKNSIRKTGKNILAYIAYKTFTPECRGYSSSYTCEEALRELNNKCKIMELGIKFHISHSSLNELRKEYKEHKGEYMTYVEKKIPSLMKVI